MTNVPDPNDNPSLGWYTSISSLALIGFTLMILVSLLFLLQDKQMSLEMDLAQVRAELERAEHKAKFYEERAEEHREGHLKCERALRVAEQGLTQ